MNIDRADMEVNDAPAFGVGLVIANTSVILMIGPWVVVMSWGERPDSLF